MPNKSAENRQGTCHCGTVRFEVQIASDARVSRCNCSICRRTGAATTTVQPSAFRLLSGEEHLQQYEFGGRTAKRLFCKTCGIHCFVRAQFEGRAGDYVSVNLNCVDDREWDEAQVVHWDGRHDNWCARSTPWPLQANWASSP